VTEAPVLKDPSSQQLIPSVWRPVFCEIVRAFVRGDWTLSRGVPGVSPIPARLAERMAAYVRSYGETLVELPEQTWESSVCIWTGDRWDTIVDLWTVREGRSDLILQTFVSEAAGGFRFDVHLVYVP
jgi:hypothetical protein